MIDELSALLEGIPDEEIAMMMGLGTNDERDGLLQQQMMQADALRRPVGQHSTPLGSALGGLAHVVGEAGAAYKTDKLNDGRKELLDAKDTGRTTYMQRVAEALRRGQMPMDDGMTFSTPTMMR